MLMLCQSLPGSHSFQRLPAHIPWSVCGGTQNVHCWLHWDELALFGGWKKPCKVHKDTVLLSAQSVMSGSCSCSLMRVIKTREEKLFCLNSSRGPGTKTESQEIPAVAVHFTSLHEAQSVTCLFLSAGSEDFTPRLHQPQGQSHVASEHSWGRFPQGAFQRGLWLPGRNRTEAVVIPNVRIMK